MHVESLVIQAGLDLYSDYGIESVIKTLNPSVQLDLRDAFLYNPTWRTDDTLMKKYLKAKEMNRLVSLENNELSVKIPGDDPMDISSINSALSVQLPTKWSKLNAEN
jgi:hypothetical protein